MRRITLWLMSTIAAVVLLFTYRTSTGGGTSATADSAAGNVGSAAGDMGSAAGTSSSTAGGRTYTGSVAQTRWGPVQVTITVTANKITGVAVPTYPAGNGKDHEINAYALPILRQETVTAQSADVDTVSGATVTSEGYKQSLQAAIDAAHLP
jgi:uncharacterized protein with FMN-binding domain